MDAGLALTTNMALVFALLAFTVAMLVLEWIRADVVALAPGTTFVAGAAHPLSASTPTSAPATSRAARNTARQPPTPWPMA